MRPGFSLIAALAVAALFTGPAWPADWTVMVYMAADNDLGSQAYRNLAQMAAVGSTDRVSVVVQLDNAGTDSLPGAKRYLVEKGGLRLLSDLGKVDMADPQTLVDFAVFVGRSHPAKNYFLVLWDHGNGWPRSGSLRPTDRSIIDDWSSGNWMGVANGELRRAVEGAERALGKRIAAIGFDACLMSMVEVGCEIGRASRLMVGSEGFVQVEGWPYDAVLRVFNENPQESARELARKVVAACADSNQGQDCTFSAVDLDLFAGALGHLNTFVTSLRSICPDGRVAAARESVQTFSKFPGLPPAPTDEYVDLIDFVERIRSIPSAAAEACVSRLQKAVIASSGSGSFFTHARGMAIWFPYYGLSFKNQYPLYQTLGFARSVGWLEFLNSYYGSDDIAPTRPDSICIRTGAPNSFKVSWNRSVDLSEVGYELRELASPVEVFQDRADSGTGWILDGFSLSDLNVHSAGYSFYTGSGNGLDNRMTLKDPVALPGGGLLTFYILYNIEEGLPDKHDALYVEAASDRFNYTPLDSLYGDSLVWTERSYFIEPADSFFLRFRYATDGSESRLGGFIDDIRIVSFAGMRTVVARHPDTTFSFFNKPSGDYLYGVFATDAFGNNGSVSPLSEANVSDFAAPFSVPSPFVDSCEIVCDFPSDRAPRVRLYTLSAEIVREFPFAAIVNKRVGWDGKNGSGKEVAAGLYLVLVQDRDFRRVGTIVKVR